jgi:MFS superfamily sulfate permease-like transporter
MSFSVLSQLNWLAVVVGTIIYFAIGAVWFTPMAFGRPWQRSIGWDPDKRPPQMSPVYYAAPAVAIFVMAIAVGMLAAATGSDTFGEGITLGFIAGVGFGLAITAIEAIFDPNKPQPWTWFAITGAYHLLGILALAVVVSVWR